MACGLRTSVLPLSFTPRQVELLRQLVNTSYLNKNLSPLSLRILRYQDLARCFDTVSQAAGIAGRSHITAFWRSFAMLHHRQVGAAATAGVARLRSR
jgi:hypothetical protein